MRNISPTELALLKAARLVFHLRVEITNASGAWVDYTNAYGVNWLREVRWSGTIDRPTMQGTITLLREDASGSISLAPSMSGSPANSGGAAIIEGRLVRLSVACVLPTTLPTTLDWREVMLGIVDRLEYGKKAPLMSVEFRDIGARVLDTKINAVRNYGSTAGVDRAVVQDAIIADNWPPTVYGPPPTVYVLDPIASAFGVSPAFAQQQKGVLEALNDLAMQSGEVARYKYDATDNFVLTEYDPQRDRTTVDTTFGPGEYIELPRLERSRDDVINQVRVNFVSDVGTFETWYVEDAASIAAYGPRYMQLGLDVASQVRTFAQAAKLADSALWDLSEPVSEHVTDMFCFWPVELGDRYTFTRNDRQYDVDQTLAVLGYEHVYTAPGKARTTLTTRGKVAGMGRQWRERGNVGNLPIDKVRPSISARVTPGTAVIGASVNVYLTPSTTYTELLGVRVKFLSDVAAPYFYLCVGPADPTPRYVDSGYELGPTDWFYFTDGTSTMYRQLLANQPLLDLQIQVLYAQAVGMMSGVASDWLAVVLDTRPRPELASASISASVITKVGSVYFITIRVTFTGGRGIQSVSDIRVVDVAADPADAIVDSVNIIPGQTITRSYLIAASAAEVVDKTWAATLTPNSNPLASASTGVVGFPITVSTDSDPYLLASADDMIAADVILQAQIDAIDVPIPAIQFPFGNGATPPAVNDWLPSAPAFDWKIVGWHVSALDAAGAETACSVTFSLTKVAWSTGAATNIVVGASAPNLAALAKDSGAPTTYVQGLAHDRILAKVTAVTPGTATSILLTLTLLKV